MFPPGPASLSEETSRVVLSGAGGGPGAVPEPGALCFGRLEDAKCPGKHNLAPGGAAFQAQLSCCGLGRLGKGNGICLPPAAPPPPRGPEKGPLTTLTEGPNSAGQGSLRKDTRAFTFRETSSGFRDSQTTWLSTEAPRSPPGCRWAEPLGDQSCSSGCRSRYPSWKKRQSR